MTIELVLLAVLMFAVTYPSRALGLLTPGLDRLPTVGFRYLQLVGPAVLAALAAVNTMTITDDAGRTFFYIGIEWLAVLACLAITAWRRNLLIGLAAAVAIVAVGRALGFGGLPV
jgi:branched-subunit amino acid transport protein